MGRIFRSVTEFPAIDFEPSANALPQRNARASECLFAGAFIAHEYC